MVAARRSRSSTRRRAESIPKVLVDDDEIDGNESATSVDEEEKFDMTPPKPVSRKSVIVRTITALLMIGVFMTLLMAGHFYCIMAGVLLQCGLFRELVNVRYIPAMNGRMPWFRSLQWSWFCVSMFWVYGERLHIFIVNRESLNWLLPLTSRTAMISFTLYWLLFMVSVLNLRRSVLKFQLSQYMWTLLIICMVVLQCKFFASYTLHGLFWYWYPFACVVMNDVSAYFCGITMGKKFIQKPFFKLSPKKTWEGFLGAGLLTLVFSFFFPALLSKYTWLTCPAEGLYISPFPPALNCDPHWIFKSTVYTLPQTFFGLFGWRTLTCLPIQIHGLAYGLFASLIAPFGGFFASAIKRAYELKDFDEIFPGHGGLMDRTDCIILMICFTSFHYKYFIVGTVPTVPFMITQAMSMSPQDQVSLLNELTKLVRGTT